MVSSCLIVPAAPSRLSRRDPNVDASGQPVRDGVGRKLRPPRLDAADRAVDAELVRLSDQRPVHARLDGRPVHRAAAGRRADTLAISPHAPARGASAARVRCRWHRGARRRCQPRERSGEPRLRACDGPWGSVRLRRGSERPAGKAVRGAHHRTLAAKESGGRRARSRSSASNEPVRSAAAVTVAVRRHAHIRGPSRYEAGIGGATLDMPKMYSRPARSFGSHTLERL